MQIINLTPHTLNMITNEGTVDIPSNGLARVTFAPDTPDGAIADIPVYVTASTGTVTGLEKPKDGTVYVVSRQVYDACPNRNDLVITHQAVRGEGGRIVGCRAFARPTR